MRAFALFMRFFGFQGVLCGSGGREVVAGGVMVSTINYINRVYQLFFLYICLREIRPFSPFIVFISF